MSERIDAHTHFLPRQYRDRLRDQRRTVRISQGDRDPVLHHTDGSLSLRPGFTDMAARLEWMAENDIDRTIVSVSTPNPNEDPFDVEESIGNVRAINDGFAELQSSHPDRIAALGSLPLRDPEAALAELDRIDGDLDLAGVALPTAVTGTPLSDPALRPVFDRLEKTGLTAFLHPTPNALSDTIRDEEWAINPVAIFPTETTVQVCRLLFDGFFDRHDFDVVIAHLGGAIPYLAGRFERGRSLVEPERRPERPIEEYLSSFYYDTISFHGPAVRAAIETVGVEQLMFGTDYPFGIEDAESAEGALDPLLEDDTDRRDVYGGTAAEVFDW